MVVIAHSSDLHLDDRPDVGVSPLRRVLAAAERARADVVLLAGDTFENVRLPIGLFERAAELLAAARAHTVILPGNHDPIFEESLERWSRVAEPDNVSVIGLPAQSVVWLPELELEVWGKPHRDYSSMPPLPAPTSRTQRWQVTMAHGHYSEVRTEPGRPSPSWLIFDDDLVGLGADYVALGHWNCATQVGDGSVPAYYSGSPEWAATINVVRLEANGVTVALEPL